MYSRSLRLTAACALATAALAGCDTYGTDMPGRHYASDVPAAHITGPAVSCIPLASISESRVRDGRTIDFLTSSHAGWRNVLPYDCPSLATERAFSYETSLSQLCSTDIIHVIDTVGGGVHRGASCGLGHFTPIDLRR